MIRIKRIQLRNFLSYKECDFWVGEGCWLVVGENLDKTDLTDSNGSGKSAIFEALVWGLYGKSSRGEVSHNGEGNCCVRVEFSVDSVGDIVIERYWKDKKKKNSLVLEINGEKQEFHSKKEIQNEIEKLIGLSYQYFIASTVIQGFQFRLSSFLGKAQFREFLSDLIDFDWDRLIGLAKRKLKETEDTIYQLQIEEDKLKQVYNQKIGYLDMLEKELQDYDEKQLNKALEEKEKIENEIEEIESEIELLTGKVKKLQEKYESYLALNRKLKDLRNKPKVCPVCKRPFDNVEEIDQHIRLVEKDLAKEKVYYDKYNSFNEMIQELQRQKQDKASELWQVRNKIEEYQKLSKISSEQETLRKELEKIEKKINTLHKKIKKEEEKRERYDEFKSLMLPSGGIRKAVTDYYFNIFKLIVQDLSSKIEGEPIDIDGVDYAAMSGGERRRLDIILHLALSELITGLMHNTQINMIVMDEVLDGLDFKAANKVVQFILDYYSNKTFYMITHDNRIKDLFDNIIVVKKENGISYLSQ